jgi:hypothetical protein
MAYGVSQVCGSLHAESMMAHSLVPAKYASMKSVNHADECALTI